MTNNDKKEIGIARKDERKKERQAKMALEIKKLKDMKSFKDRVDYIWEYYRISIVSTLIVISIIAYAINITLINPPDKPGVSLVITNPTLFSEAVLKNSIEENLNIEQGYEAVVTFLPLGSSSKDITYEQSLQQKLFIMITVGEIDLIIASEELITANAVGSMFLDVTQVLTDSKYKTLEDKFIKGLIPKDMADPKTVDDSQIVEFDTKSDKIECVERPVGIKIDGCKVLEDLGYNTKGSVIAFPTTSKRPEIKMELFDYIMSIK